MLHIGCHQFKINSCGVSCLQNSSEQTNLATKLAITQEIFLGATSQEYSRKSSGDRDSESFPSTDKEQLIDLISIVENGCDII